MELSLQSLMASFKKGRSSKSSHRVVGIDIGSVSIKVVEVENRNSVLTLTTYGELQIGNYADKELGDVTSLNQEQQKRAVVDVLREAAVHAQSGVFAMPLSSSFVTVMSLEAKPDEDISSRVRVEARKYIPVPITEVTIDWAELSNKGSKSSRNILLAAIQNDEIEKLQTLMSSINMNNQPTEIECFSTVRSLFVDGDKSVATIDIGGDTSKLYVTVGGLVQRMHRVRAGGAMVTKRVADLLDITFAEAELKKRDFSKEDPHFHDIQKAARSSFERPLMEFKRVIDQYEGQTGEVIGRIELSGGAILMPGMKVFAEEVLQREVELANPFTKLAYPAFMEDTLKEIGPLFTVALGSALRVFE